MNILVTRQTEMAPIMRGVPGHVWTVYSCFHIAFPTISLHQLCEWEWLWKSLSCINIQNWLVDSKMVLVRASAHVIRKITKLRFKLWVSHRSIFVQLEPKRHNLAHLNCQLGQEILVCARCGASVYAGLWVVMVMELEKVVTFKNY